MYAFTRISGNQALGPIPVVTSPASTCPPSCSLRNGGGCYAEYGPLSWFWRRLGPSEQNFEDILSSVRSLPKGTLWRWGQAGDLPGKGLRIDRRKLLALARASYGKPCLCYSHKPVSMTQLSHRSGVSRRLFSAAVAANRSAIRAAAALGFRVNVSCESIAQAKAASKLGFSAVLVGSSGFKGAEIRSGMRLTACPQKVGRVANCLECKGLCARERDAVIVFPAHGSGRNHINQRELDL